MQVFQKGIRELRRFLELCKFSRREFGNYLGFWNYVGFSERNFGIMYVFVIIYVGFPEGNSGIT